MNFCKIIITIITTCSFFSNNSNASVICYYSAYDGYSIECDGIKKHFDDIEELSNNINDITSKYFTVDSVDNIKEMDTILFYDFDNKKDSNYKLIMHGSISFHPSIMLHYRDNQVDIPDIELHNILALQIYSNVYNYPLTCKINDKYLDKVLFKGRPIKKFYHNDYLSGCKII